MSASQQIWAFGIAVVFRIGCRYSLSVEAAAKKPFRSSAVTVASLSALLRLSVKLRAALQSCLVPASRLIRLSNLEFCLLIRHVCCKLLQGMSFSDRIGIDDTWSSMQTSRSGGGIHTSADGDLY